ncbi:MAG: hypothetical protein ACRDH9_08610 [Actinomycetota bacterium]
MRRFYLAVSGCLVLLFVFVRPGLGQTPPEPIDPGPGEERLLEIINEIPLNEIDKALDNFPVPYVVVASANGAEPTITNNRAGHPTRVDADRSRTTGQGGHDISVEINTELVPSEHLVLTVERLGTAPFAPDLSLVIAFPFDAFNDEDSDLPGDPNLFIGFDTHGAFDGTDYPDGGVAPLRVDFSLTPDVLAGTSHTFTLGIDTLMAQNPIRYLGGHFDGNVDTGLLDATGMAALADPVPASIDLSVGTGESPIDVSPAATTDTALQLGWTATTPAKVIFDYLENEDFPFTIPDYNTTVTVDQMPTDEELSLTLDEAAQSLTLSHRGNLPINEITFLKEREDGLTVRGVGGQVPTEVDLTAALDGAVELDVNFNTLDLSLEASQVGGFLSTADFLSYDVGFLRVGLTDVPDLTGELHPEDDTYRARATNPGESIGSVEVLIDDGPVGVFGGGFDVDGDGDADADDDGSLAGLGVIDGAIDLNDDGSITIADGGAVPGSVPATSLVAGLADLSGDGSITETDTAAVTLLVLPPAYDSAPQNHLFSLTDTGTEGTIAGRLVNLSEGALDLDAPPVIDGRLDLNADGVADAADDGTVAFDVGVVDGLLDINADSAGDGADDGKLYGRDVMNGEIDIDGNDAVNADDDGELTAHTFVVETTLPAPLEAFLSTEPGSTLVPGRDVDATCDVQDIPAAQIEAHIALPPPSVNIGYEITPPTDIDSIHCFGHVDAVAFDVAGGALPPVFEFDFDPDEHVAVTAEDGLGGSDPVGFFVARFCDDPDMDGVCVVGENGTGIPGTGDLMGELRDARARVDQAPSLIGRWSDSGVTVIDGRLDLNGDAAVDGADDGRFATQPVIDGFVDGSGNGSIGGDDDILIAGRTVYDGAMDVDDDGDVDGNDDGSVSGSAFDYDVLPAGEFTDGIQVAVATAVGLDELPVADPAQDHYLRFEDAGSGPTPPERVFAGGVFGLERFTYSSSDENGEFAAHYDTNLDHRLVATFDSAFGGRFFPDYDTDLTLTIDDVPETIDVSSDLATEFVYEASDSIDSVTIGGTIDDTDDSDDTNGTNVDFLIDSLPSQAAFHLEATPTPVASGALDVNGGGVDNSDDAMLAGVRVIDGLLDLNGDGTAGAGDDGRFLGLRTIGGALDTDDDNDIDGDDTSEVAGASLVANQAIDEIDLSLTSTNKVVKTDFGLVELNVTDIPAQWNLNWGGERFLLETRDQAGNPDPMGIIQARVSSTADDSLNDANIEPFTLPGDAASGPVLNTGSFGNCRIRYSNFTQQVDRDYYNAEPGAGESQVQERLGELYCDSEILSADGDLVPTEDHVLARLEDTDADGDEDDLGFGSFRFTGFQRISWFPDDHGGAFTFRAPSPGTHELFGGFERADEFSTLQVENIPDQVKVDVDDRERILYEADDDTNASIGEIDFYQGPLPMAEDDDDATRAVIRFDPNTPNVQLHDEIDIGWKFGFPNGGAYFDSSEEIEALLLTQNGSNRITGGLGLEDLHFGYAIDLFSFDVLDSIEICIPLVGCAGVPIEWELVDAKAGIDNVADGLDPTALENLNPDDIAGDPSQPTLDGFVGVYKLQGSPTTITGAPGTSDPDGEEYVPLVTADEKNFNEFSVKLVVSIDPTDPGATVYPIDINFTPKLTGDLVIDVWSPVNTHEILGTVPLIGEVGFTNPPDYSENSPFHIIPGLFEDPGGNARISVDHDAVFRFDGWHHFDPDHFDPFGA